MTDESTAEGRDGQTRRSFVKTGALASSALALGSGATVVAASGDGDESGQDESGTATPTEGDDGDGGEDQAPANPFASAQFFNQESGGDEVVVQTSTLSQPGYIAFHDPSLLQGNVVESVIGVSEFLERGFYFDTTAQLFDVPGGQFDQTALQDTTPVIAMPHRETSGNREYNFVTSGGEKDGPFTEAGLPVIDLAFVVVGGDGGDGTATPTPTAAGPATETPTGAGGGTEQPFASVDFSNQRFEDEVTVGEAVLSDGGFVALHDARLFQGQPFESVVGVSEYLGPGRHQSIEIPLEDPGEIAEVALPAPPLIPIPHRDTNGNQEYDFVDTQGEADPSYLRAGQPVADIGLVLRGDGGETGTEETGTEDEDGTETESGA